MNLPKGSSSSSAPITRNRLSNNRQRVLTGIVAIPLFLICLVVGGWLFFAMLLLLTVIGLLEFYRLVQNKWDFDNQLIVIVFGIVILLATQLGAYPVVLVTLLTATIMSFLIGIAHYPDSLRHSLQQSGWSLTGLVYIVLPLSFLIGIRQIEQIGVIWVLAIFASTAGADTFAYYGGRAFGSRKLAPRISPNKTVEGAISGVIGSMILTGIILAISGLMTAPTLIVIFLAPLVSIVGDLFESGLKRYFHVKDSGIPGFNPFPGHGGVLDRIDALLWVITLYFGYLVISGVIRLG